jgi:high affinity sulfate transporter 1
VSPTVSERWRRWLPGLTTLSHYNPAWLRNDIPAGLALAAMLVPVGIAYAVAAGLPGIYGLYATIVPLLVYALLGPSRILVLGPDSSLAGIILSVVLPLSGGDPERAVALASAMALVAGIAGFTAGLARLGFLTDLLSTPIRYGYMNGIAVTVLISQLPKFSGLPSPSSDNTIERLLAFIHASGNVHLPSLLLGLGTLAIILGLARWPRVPGILVAVIASMTAVALFDLPDQHVAVLGDMPQGLPHPAWPGIGLSDLGAVVFGGLTMALLASAETAVLSRSYATHLNMQVDQNQEMAALGAANVMSGLFQGFPISSSASRTPVLEAAGGRTQVAVVVSALAVAALLLWAPGLLHNLPQAALAGVVIAAISKLFSLRELLRIYRMQPWECWLSVACSIGVIVAGPITGIALAVVLAVIEFLWDGWRPHFAVLGRVDEMKGYHDTKRHPEARLIDGLVLFRWDAPLFFANADGFQTEVLRTAQQAPTTTRWLVVASEPITSVDITAADMLAELDDTLRERGVQLCFAEMKDPVKDKLRRFGLYPRFQTHFFPTLGQAVNAYLDNHPVQWVDWEDRTEDQAAK